MTTAVLLIKANSSLESVSSAGAADDAECTTRILLTDFRDAPIDLRRAPFDKPQRFVRWMLVADDKFAVKGLPTNLMATALVRKGAKAHRDHQLTVRGDCTLEATLCYVKPGETKPTCNNCPIDVVQDDLLQLLRGNCCSMTIDDRRCPVHR